MNLDNNLNYITVSSNSNKATFHKDNYYEKDPYPYYGPQNDRPIKIPGNYKDDKFLTPIEIRDLSLLEDSDANKNRLKEEIKKIETEDNKVYNENYYFRDTKPYYDPTAEYKEKRKEQLTEALDKVTKDLNKDQPIFSEENFTLRSKFQNYMNWNKEKNNNYIKNNFWTDAKGFDSNFFNIFYYFN